VSTNGKKKKTANKGGPAQETEGKSLCYFRVVVQWVDRNNFKVMRRKRGEEKKKSRSLLDWGKRNTEGIKGKGRQGAATLLRGPENTPSCRLVFHQSKKPEGFEEEVRKGEEPRSREN